MFLTYIMWEMFLFSSSFFWLRERENKDVFYFHKTLSYNNPKALTDQKCSKLKAHSFIGVGERFRNKKTQGKKNYEGLNTSHTQTK